jgi:hypothetical protein
MENECTYVSSRGLLKSCDVFSGAPVSSTQRVSGYKFATCQTGNSVYVCGSALRHFALTVLPHLPPIVLVTGDCDQTCWQDMFPTHADFVHFIEMPTIRHWFSQNAAVQHPKLTQIPIGLDYHTMTKSAQWGPIMPPLEQEFKLKTLPRLPFWKRRPFCYSNFHFSMNTKHAYDRREALRDVPRALVYYEPVHVTREQSWITQTQYAFVLSPHGGGLDCHRTWEALALGCIPIVKTSPLDPLYDGLPVVIVKEWSAVTPSLLTAVVSAFQTQTFDYNKLTLAYWVDKIKNT